MAEETEYRQFTIEPTTDRPKVQFEGVLLATADGRRKNSYRWKEIKAYKTQAGKYVLETIGHTTVEDEITLVDYRVCKTESDVVDFLGHTQVAERLYEKLGIGTITIL